MAKKLRTAIRIVIAVMVTFVAVYAGWCAVARTTVRRETASLIVPVLNAAIRNTDTDADQRRVDERLDAVLSNKSDAADEAVAILLGYNIGVHNAEELDISSTQRGKRVLPYLMKYRRKPAMPLRPEFWLLRLNRATSDRMYDDAIALINQGKVLVD